MMLQSEKVALLVGIITIVRDAPEDIQGGVRKF